MKFFKANFTEVTERVNDGRTKFFEASKQEEAQEFAKHTRSYLYEVFKGAKKRNEIVFAGFGVPK